MRAFRAWCAITTRRMVSRWRCKAREGFTGALKSIQTDCWHRDLILRCAVPLSTRRASAPSDVRSGSRFSVSRTSLARLN
jgi:hypothetical protein